jgi:WD40 repeat protein
MLHHLSLADRSERFLVADHQGAVRAVAFTSVGHTFASASEDQTAALWDAQSGKQIAKLTGHMGFVVSLAFTPRRDSPGDRRC